MSDLAVAASVSVSTIERMEMAGQQPISDEVRASARAALETAGMRFLDDEGEGAGMRLGAP